MIARVSVKSGAAKAVIPPPGESLSSAHEFTILNTDENLTVELVESTGASWGSGFPLAPGAAWSGTVGSDYKQYVIAQDATAVSVAILGVAVPA